MTGNRVAEFTSKVILSEVKAATQPQNAARPGFQFRCGTGGQFRGLLRLRSASLRMTAFGKAQRS
jgi:hypothetical protein